ncbi:MAG: hypothetical protein ACK4UN_16920 [Limisphaerales bacterium]
MRTKPPVQSPSAKTFWLLGGSVFLGSVAFFYVFAIAWFASMAETNKLVLLLWCGGATIISASVSAAQPYLRIYWSIGFAMPMFVWGLLNAVFVPLNELPILWWTVYGIATAACAVAGALIGRRVTKVIIEKDA